MRIHFGLASSQNQPMFKKIIIIVVVLFFLSINYFPSPFNCARFVPSACGLMSNVIFIMGSAQMIRSEVKYLFSPDKEVEVVLDDGSSVPGKLTAKAMDGRLVKTGDKVRLNCTSQYALPDENGIRNCSLDFLRRDPFGGSCSPGSPCHGVIPSWGIAVDNNGQPDPDLLKITLPTAQ